MSPTNDDDAAPRRPRRWRRWVLALVVGPTLLLIGLAGVVWAVTDVPLPGEVQVPELSVVQYADGSEMARVGTENRVQVPLEQVSPAARFAVLAAEDRGFYSSAGVSPKGVLRALWVNLRRGEVAQGGSTISQQYVRGAVLTPERTLSRKLREAAIAVKLQSEYSKDEILELYLNRVYFGRGAYGVEAAAQTFFGGSAADLTAAQGAVLAAQLRAPSAYDPQTDPDRARERWRYVVNGMVEQGWLDGPAAAQEFPQVAPLAARDDSLGGPQGYLVQQALEELARAGIGEDRLDRGGLVVQTTIDRRAQEEAVASVLETSGPDVPDGVFRALVSVEPGTGRIVAEYAGPDYVGRPFNSVTQGTAQAGSSFKPYVLAAALNQGVPLRTTFDGASPQVFADNYRVSNFGGGSFGRMDLVEATAQSVNTVYVPLGLRAGTETVASTAAALGITADMSVEDSLASISLGVTAVSPLDQAVAFATLAADGLRAQPYIVERVTDRQGGVLHEAEVVTEQVLPENVARDVTFALQQVVSRGTGRRAQLPDRPAAGKTGTTNENTAAWFVGYTPQLSTAVAIYSERQDTPLRGIAGVREVTGGTLPARTWSRYMTAALAGQPVLEFPEPSMVGPPPIPTPTLSTPSPAPDDAVPPPPAPPAAPTDPQAPPAEPGAPSAEPQPAEPAPSRPPPEPLPLEVPPASEG